MLAENNISIIRCKYCNSPIESDSSEHWSNKMNEVIEVLKTTMRIKSL